MRWAVASVAAVLIGLALAGTASAEFRDAPALVDTVSAGRNDLGPLYVFRSPTNANNTVLVLTVNPFAGGLSPATFTRGARYDIKIDRTADGVEDLTFRTTFGPVSPSTGAQPMLIRCVPKPRCPRYVLARGNTATNLPVAGGGLARAAVQDNPMFFDQGSAATGGWEDLAADGVGSFPRPVGVAKNFYRATGNALAIVIELPSSRIAPNNALIGVWSRLTDGGGQVDREGRPFINVGVVPRLPRNTNAPALPESRDALNHALPRRDIALFLDPMRAVLQLFYGRTSADANAIANLLLPDHLIFQIGNPNGFGTFVVSGTGNWPGTQLGNGRRLRDDVYDITINILTNGGITSDNVPDDNGTRITDGNMGTVAAFPYIGAPNLPLNGAGNTPNP